jgi:hypothetical protein
VTYAAKTVEFQIYIPSGTTEIDIPWTGEGTVSAKSTFGINAAGRQKLTLDVKGFSGWFKLQLQLDGNITLKDAAFSE